MTTRKTQTTCPNCRQPVLVEFEQLFDINQDPEAKTRLLSGQANLIQCPNCGYNGPYSVPLVYHDAEKELLLTFVPPDLGLPMHEQERVIGPLINQVVNNLPQEERKAYLLQPRTMLTQQTLMETILEADGITKEMIQAQQEKLNLLQRLANASSDEVMVEIAEQEESLIDEEFFTLMQRMVVNALMSGDRGLAQRLSQVQETILPVTSFGRQLQEQTEEINAAAASLQELGEHLTREKLLDLVVNAPNETRVRALVSLARQGMDYQFFQLLSERIDRARSAGRARLAELREKLLVWTREYDEQMQAQREQLKNFLDALIESENIREQLTQSLPTLPDSFLQVVQTELEAAHKAGDLERSGKIQQVLDILDELSQASPEVEIINALVGASDAETRLKILQSLPKDSLTQIAETLTGLAAQIEARGDPELTEQVQTIYGEVLKYSMRMQMQN